ncbi:DNA primase [Fibrobacteres bacterium R8-0-B4]
MMTADEIKSKLDILTVVRDWYRVELKPQGAEYKGFCPLHDEKTVSFSVNVEKGAFYCFGCGEGGDLIRFVRLKEGFGSDGEAMKYIEARLGGGGTAHVGHGVSAAGSAKEAAKAADTRPRHRVPGTPEIAEYMKRCAEAYKGGPGDEYMKSRGISTETATRLNVGYGIGSIIYPDSAGGFKARKIAAADKDDRFKASSYGQRGVFPANAREILTESAVPIFIVEGEADALSIYEACFNSAAIAVGSAANRSALIYIIMDIESKGGTVKSPLIIAFDSDENGTGAKAAKEMADGIKAKTRAAVFNAAAEDAPPELDILGGSHDPNDALKANSAEFAKRVTAAESAAMSMFEARLDGGTAHGHGVPTTAGSAKEAAKNADTRSRHRTPTDDDKAALALDTATNRRHTIINGDQFEATPIEWLYENVLPRGGLSTIQGIPGDGKTFAALAIAAAVSSGGQVPTVDVTGDTVAPFTKLPMGKVLYLSGDDTKERLKERAVAMGGTMSNINFAAGDTVPPLDDPELEMMVKDVGDGLLLLVIDPLQNGLSGINMNNANDSVEKITKLKRISEKYNIAVLVIQHVNKIYTTGRGTPAIYAGIGSSAINGIFRSVWTSNLLKDDDGKKTSERAIIPTKLSYVDGDAPSIIFSLSKSNGFKWVCTRYGLDADCLYSQAMRQAHRPNDKMVAAIEIICAELSTGPKLTNDLQIKVMSATGCSLRTCENAIKKAGAITERDKVTKSTYITRLLTPGESPQ